MKEPKRRATREERSRAFSLAEEDPVLTAMLSLVWDNGLTLKEMTEVKWEDVDLSGGALRVSGRMVPLPPETREALIRLGEGGGYVFPSRVNTLVPITRMTANRRLRAVLDAAGLPDLHPKELREQYVLRLMETIPLDQVSQASGIEKRTLQDIWKEYGKPGLPQASPRHKGGGADALDAALRADGDCLDTRIIRLSWQGGLYVREMRLLRWTHIAGDFRTWTVNGTVRPVPPPLRPWLEQWRRAGGDWVLAGTRSGQPGDTPFLTRRAAEFLVRHGLGETSLTWLRGRGMPVGEYGAALRAYAEERGRFQLKTAARVLKLPLDTVRAAACALLDEGVLEREARDTWRLAGIRTAWEQFQTVLADSAGKTLSSRALQEQTGLSGSRFHYYINNARKEGRLERLGHGWYRVL